MKAFLLLLAMNAWAGNEHGNGGDSYSLEFVTLGRKMVREIRQNPDPRIPESALVVAVEVTDVVTKDKLELRGAEVDAINYPAQKRIELNRSRWKEYSEKQKTALVLHEYLGVIGVDDSRYEISGKYSAAASQVAGSSSASFSDANQPSRFSLSLGAGLNSFGHNMGKIYSASSPSMDFRLSYALLPKLTFSGGFNRGGFSTDIEPYGVVEMTLNTATFSVQYHPLRKDDLSAALGIDPYASAGFDQVFRAQKFSSLSDVQRDHANAANVSIGSNFFFSARTAALWIEGKASQIFFNDRYDQSFLASGLVDSTGLLYTASAGVQYFF